MRELIRWFGAFFLTLLFAGSAFAARTFTVTIPNNTTCGPTSSASLCVTMGDANATLPHRITNTGNENKQIKEFTFNLPAGSDYNFSTATTAPSGWEVKSISALSVRFSVLAGGTGITDGNFLDFFLVVTGPNGEPIPPKTQDVTETALSSVAVIADGGYSQSGALPTWTRKSLAILLIATPSTVGVSGTITLEMQISNRSSATQNGIGSSPDPPTRIYTLGTLVTQLTGPIRDPDPMNLAPGETGTITWTFQAGLSGTVTFEASAGNATPATSIIVRSNTITIGNFTAAIAMDSTAIVSGQSLNVTLTITNNGSTSLTNVTLHMTPNGSATSIDCNGDSISDKGLELTQNMGLLGGGGMSVSSQWTCTVTGTVGQTFFFSGYATADGSLTTVNTAVTPTGTISSYSVDVNPDTVASGSVPPNKTFSWTVYNRGNAVVKEVWISIPSPCNSPPSPCDGWEYAGANPGANWTALASGNPENLVKFQSNNPVDTFGIPVGGSRAFTITFSSVPSVDADTPYAFPVTIVDKNTPEAKAPTINTAITVTAYSLTLTADPTSISGDGAATSTITATLAGPSPDGKTISFTTTAGTLTDPSAITDASGVATVTLTSSTSCTDVTATVTGSYGNAIGNANVIFTGLGTAGNLSYIGEFRFIRTNPAPGTILPPIIVNPKDQGYFELKVQNTGCNDPVKILINGSSLSVGSDIYPLIFIDGMASDKTLLDDQTAILQFGDTTDPITICTGSSGTSPFTPLMTIDGESPPGTPYDQAFAADKAPPGDTIPDTVTVTGSVSACVRILDWREVR